MGITWTGSQRQRLKELNADSNLLDQVFVDTVERDQSYLKNERLLVKRHKEHLQMLRDTTRRPLLCRLESKLVDCLTSAGFVQVVTPVLLVRGMLEKMTITRHHPLNKQVFWVGEDKCLRPMLAPNLYYLMRELVRLWGKPMRIFEVGPCFRKESQGTYHLNEFTMLNLVEVDDLEGRQQPRLRELAALVMAVVGIDYRLETTESDVYGETIDVVSGDLELGSGSFGPHRLDQKWGIVDPWVGIGFGLERLAVAVEGHRNIHRAGRSLSYLDGARLNI